MDLHFLEQAGDARTAIVGHQGDSVAAQHKLLGEGVLVADHRVPATEGVPDEAALDKIAAEMAANPNLTQNPGYE